MSIATLDTRPAEGTGFSATVGGVFRRALDAMIEARLRRVEIYLKTFNLQIDDETLALAGLTRADLKDRPLTGRD